MTPWFIATERFDPSDGDAWSKYIAWCGLNQLTEVVSLDGMLNPTLLPVIKDEYWPHIVNANFRLNYFVDYDYLIGEVAGFKRKNVLCVFQDPEVSPTAPFPFFKFLGYDIVDKTAQVSALSNCGGYPKVFSPTELSSQGLLPSLERAVKVRNDLRTNCPDESHTDCNYWAIFRAEP